MFAIWALAVFASVLVISGYHRARARRLGGTISRRSEGSVALAARAIGGFGAAAAVLGHALTPDVMTWASFPAPAWLRVLGGFLGTLLVPGAYWVVSSIGQNISETVLTKRQHELVERGPYRSIRHPLYALGVLLFAALGLLLASWLLLALGLTALLVFRLVVVPIEERHLVEHFGDAYVRYAARTGAMFPRLRARA